MAEASKSERSSLSKKAPESDFSPFDDWLIDGPTGEWPGPWESKQELSEKQKAIVVTNAELILDREEWHKKVSAFEAALSALQEEVHRADKRAKYEIRFDQHRFVDGDKNFSRYVFPCSVSFQGTDFGDGDISFHAATFSDGDVRFGGATFGIDTLGFMRTVFGNGHVSFERVKFGDGNASFKSAIFGSGDVSFFEASFGQGNILLLDANFELSSMYAPSMEVAGNLFVQSNFFRMANFRGLHVEGSANFSGSGFAKVPDFGDAKFDRPPQVAGMRVPRPKLKGWNRISTDPGDVAKYRKLKAMALAANDHEKDGEFFAGEMLAKRGTETNGFFGLLFNTIYWWLSDFGQSFVRPICWLGISFLAFAAACLYLIRDALTLTDRLWFAADYSFRNMLPLFRFAPAPQEHLSWYQKIYDHLASAGVDIDRLISLGIFQSLIGTVLLFFFLLALRNRFLMK